jgi:hypothetical protein
MHGPYIALTFGVGVLLLAGLFSRRSTWPKEEAMVAAALTTAALLVQQFESANDPWWSLSPMFMTIAIPLGVSAAILWIYIIGRAIRRIWFAWR